MLAADAEALAVGLTGRPDLVKSNHHEAERLLGRALDDDAELLRAAQEMREKGAATAVVTAGARGAFAVSDEGAWRSWPPPTVVVSAVGAGDALLAGLLLKLEEGGDMEEALRWGTAAGAAACLTSGTQLCRRADVIRLLSDVRVRRGRLDPPAHGAPGRAELATTPGAMFLDRFIATAMYYPFNYGYIPHTLSDDGDPADVMVVAPVPLISGSVIACRAIGMLGMTDEAGEDGKILAVPITKLTAMYSGVDGIEDMPQALLAQISHFFEHYKDLESGKWVKITGWSGKEAAHKEITDSIARFEKTPKKPAF